ncbi:gem (nuclear organelle) associated protein 2 [Mortierella hygrophila]|uniref:Gem (Nuclear organelle) associated protein 2 n=1 Tax=Mortierella hygrophila TaxID=979708 RepID=A0A9P6FHE5_9FUNG|nr:gem (nuclear organelle) associated protein 2 [Mortierella hygrophila]
MDNMLPSSGEEYLRMVKAQARKCPAVVVASGARTQKHLAAKNTSRKYRTDWQSCLPAPEGCAPTLEWKDQFMKDFNVARANLKRYKQFQERQAKRGGGGGAGGGAKSKQDKGGEQEASENEQVNIPKLDRTQPPCSSTYSKPVAAARTMVLPKMHDEQRWRTLLYGPTPSPSAPVSHVASTTAAVVTEAAAPLTPFSITTTTTTATATSTTITGAMTTPASATTRPAPMSTGAILQEWMSPSPQFLIRLDQGHLIQLLKYHLRWLAEDDLQEHEEKWLYAVFLKLDVLVESDQVAVLRNIAKKCARIRSHFHSDSGSKLATVNMVITIVARLFGQGDLE